ncbi:MFS transporter [Tunicatimonas pelagia]|uniref:MFS transporter n=1 Tax=Tunicatimonas pelagia TaxID=931531 RepID=UPI002665A436|nr:MFS transporter [Tunicatimonas pelagia]WKN43193.1 MFS transporter [Tunicatimonas pelagia]
MTEPTSTPDITLSSSAGKWILFSTILASSMAFIDSTALNVILPSLQNNLQANGTDIFWILNAYLLMLASLILVGGTLGDKLGRKKIFMIGIAIFMVGSVACGFAPTVEWLIGARAVQGIGGALMIPGSLSIISATFHHQEKGKAIGTWSAATTLVTVGGPILGGALGDAGLWRAIFFINLPIGLASLVVLYRKVPESSNDSLDHRLDYAGAITVVLGLALLTFGFLEIPELGWSHWKVYGTLATGAILLVAFVRIEQVKSNPMVPLSLFKDQTFTGANLLTFLLYAGLAIGMLFLSLNLVQVQGYRQVQAGMTLLPFTILLASLARWVGGLVDRYGSRWLLVSGSVLAGFGFFWFSTVGLTEGPSQFWTTYFPGILLFGLGMSLTVVPLTTTVMASVADQHSGTASGINNAMTRTANVFANATVGALAVVLFTNYLEPTVDSLLLSESNREAIMQQAANLGDAQVPKVVPIDKRDKVQQAFQQSFIDMFNQLMYISAGLAWVSAAVAFILIKKRQITEK